MSALTSRISFMSPSRTQRRGVAKSRTALRRLLAYMLVYAKLVPLHLLLYTRD